MQTIEEYLKGEFREGKGRLEQIQDTLVQIARLFDKKYVEDYQGWCYEFGDQPLSEDDSYSYSTQAMCALALSRLAAAAFWDERQTEEQSLRGQIAQKKDDCVGELCSRLTANAQQQKEALWGSRTYGGGNSLTASWIVELLSISDESGFVHSLDQQVRERLRDAIHRALSNNYDRIILVENRAGAHAFPVLRCVLAAQRIQAHAGRWNTTAEEWQNLISRAGCWFEQQLQRQLSYYHFGDFRFDAPELIYCLAGALRTGRLPREDRLISDVLKVIKASQQRSVYWRPYRPFLVRPEGLVLMPLTVEAADAFLDTLEWTDSFPQLSESVRSYYDWLIAQRRLEGDHEDRKTAGWRSENTFAPSEPERTHAWTTSRVAIFLLDYSRLLDRSLQSDLLSQSGLSVREIPDPRTWRAIQPMDLGRRKQVKRIIEESFVTPHRSARYSEERLNRRGSFSMFLYGPPGTSKTSLAEGLAAELGFKLVAITASDFILQGVQAVEQRAKVIFDVLGELKNVVVLFDEIDRLITDRDCQRYLEQGDILQLMTPSMLTKLNELRRKKKLIFVISTNYYERIDRAIRRPGRIDNHFLIPPFDQESRVALLKHFICQKMGEKGKDWKPPYEYEKQLNGIARQNPLLVFEEIKHAYDKSMSRLGDEDDISTLLSHLEEEIARVRPSIAVESYENRFASSMDPDKPYDEYFCLCFLLAEVHRVDKNVKKNFKARWAEWSKKNGAEASELKSDPWVRERLQELGVCVEKSQAG